MLYTPLKSLSYQNERSTQNKSSDLELSSDFESICRGYLKGEIKLNSASSCVCVYGEPGYGRTTCLLEICGLLLRRCFIKESEILGIRVKSGCSLQSLWNFLSGIAKEKQDRDTASLLSQSTVKLRKKYAVAEAFISSHFKLICVDDADSDGGIVWSHLSQILDKLNAQRVVVISRKGWDRSGCTQSEAVIKVKVKGVTTSFCENYITRVSSQSLNKAQISKICSLTSCNPIALKLFFDVLREFQLLSETVECFLLSFEDQPGCQSTPQAAVNPIIKVLQFCFQYLSATEKHTFRQLCQLREPLPMLEVPVEVEKLVALGLVTQHVAKVTTGTGKSIFTLSVASSLQWSSSHLTYPTADDFVERKLLFNAFDAWYSLISVKLQDLVSDAEENAWPFVPEKWQYISHVGAAESYNIKELITAKNSVVPFLIELDILEECLFHAVKEERYRTVAALVLVMDRFTYWQGGSHTTLQAVEHLKECSPDTAIAPQLIVRKVRVMKNSGDLQGAEQVLDELLVQKSQVGKWVYKEVHHHQLVSAVCIQIKGDIQYNLGHWAEGARLLLDSLILFSTLPIPDKKGIASSLVLLANCLQPMTLYEYLPLAQTYGLTTCHPLLQAYFCAHEAAMRSIYTPLFYARHKCRAGEFMLSYSKLIPDGEQRQKHLMTSVQDFKESIQAHKDFQSLTSREEFFLFVCAVYKMGVAHEELSSHRTGKHIEGIAMLMYEHYCSFTGVVLLDDEIRKLITHCLSYLGLQPFCEDDTRHPSFPVKNQESKVDGVTSSTSDQSTVKELSQSPFPALASKNPIKSEDLRDTDSSSGTEGRSIVRRSENTRTDCSAETVEGIIDRSNEGIVLVDHEALLEMRHEVHSVTDKMKQTREYKDADCIAMVTSAVTRSSLVSMDTETLHDHVNEEALAERNSPEGHNRGNNMTVDRDCATEESLGDYEQPRVESFQASSTVSRTAVTMETVDRAAVTMETVSRAAVTMETVNRVVVSQGLEQETVALPCARSPPSDSTADQYEMQDFKVDPSQRVHGAVVWKFDSVRNEWRCERTLAFVGNLLELEKGKKGAQRDAFMVEFLNQEDPLAKYVAKCYRKPKDVKQYQQDVICQMTARYYVRLFNQQLYQAGVNIGHVQFLPVALLQLTDDNNRLSGVYNVEPFMAGDFVKLTNNFEYVRSDNKVSALVLTFSHFSFQTSNELLIIVDIQGWTPTDKSGCTFLTDPQIHSSVYKCFGSGNLGKAGFDSFWKKVHPRCNDICVKLGLVRPNV